MNPYDYLATEPSFDLQLMHTTRRWSHYGVTFPTAHPTRYEENNTVYGEYFTPINQRRSPLVILLHGLGDMSLIPCRMLARHLAGKGIACFVLYLPYHSRRTPAVLKGRRLSLPAADWLELFQVSVIDTRHVVDWATQRDEIDDKHIAVVGISMGGLTSAIAMGVDYRITAGVFVVTGGNLEVLSWQGMSRATRGYHACRQDECHQIYSLYPQYLASVAQNGLDKVTPPRECFLFDPLTFSPWLRGRPILMVNALWDGIIPKRSTLELWEACGKPPILWLPATHLTIYIWYPLISRKVTTFLKSTFNL